MSKKTLFILISAIVFSFCLTACTYFPQKQETGKIEDAQTTQNNESKESDPIIYNTMGVDVEVTKETKPFRYSVENLEGMAKDCGRSFETKHFDDLVSSFGNTEELLYKFKYKGESQSPDTLTVVLLPNLKNYKTMDEFNNDFQQCFAGGDMHPYKLSDNWLLFESSCGTGYSDGSERPIGCQKINENIILNFNE